MLYLAEVQKKSTGVFGGGKAELKLLAYQRSEQNWTAVTGDEIIPSDEANNHASGALVLVDVSANRQVQRIQEAGRPLVSILQNFSRLQEKFKTQEEEIEQWKQSLTYQSQELNRREMEMEARREQLQQMEEDFEQLEQQRQEVEILKEQVNRQRDEFERNQQDLEGAWAHFRGEKSRFEEQASTVQGGAGLDQEKAQALQELCNRIAGEMPPTTVLQEQLGAAFEVFGQHQDRLGHHWQALEQQRSRAQQSQAEVEQKAQEIQTRWQEWHRAQESLEQARAELKAQQAVLNTKQEYARMLSIQVQGQDDLHQQVYRLADTSDNVKIGFQVDSETLEKMPLDELQRLVQELEGDLEKLSRFVESQEEELRFKQQDIDELKQKISAANEFDRLNLENELSDEQDAYQMLHETLIGQRRSLQERKGILSQHQSIFRRRQGIPAQEGQDNVIDLSPILSQLDVQRQQQAEDLQKLEAQVEQMKTAIQQAEGLVASQSVEQENRRNELKQMELELENRRIGAAELQGRVGLYQEMLQPIQDSVDGLRQRLEHLSGTMGQVQQIGDRQSQAIAEIRQMLASLSNAPQLVS